VVIPDVDPREVSVTSGQVRLVKRGRDQHDADYRREEAATHIGSVLVVPQSVILQRCKLLAVPVGSVDDGSTGTVFVTMKTNVSVDRIGTSTDVHVVTQVENIVDILMINRGSVGVEESVGPVGATSKIDISGAYNAAR
jgi:hypothetical protein